MSQLPDEHPDALLAEYSVTGLQLGDHRAVERHLAGCARCRARLDSLQNTVLLLRNLPAPALPRSFLLPRATPVRRTAPPSFLPLGFLSAAAVLFLALGLSLALGRSGALTSNAGSTAAGQTSQLAHPAAPRLFAAATSSAAAVRAAASASARSPAAAAPAPRPAIAAARVQQATTATAPSTTSQAVARAPASTLQPYQVLLAVGAVVCLLVATLTLVRRRTPPR